MPCAIKSPQGKVVDIKLDSGQSSLLFRALKNLPFLTEEQSLQFYAYSLTPQFLKTAKNLIINPETNEPILVFRNMSDSGSGLLNSEGLVFSDSFKVENDLDNQKKGLQFGFLKQGKEQKEKKTIKVYHGTYDKRLKKFKERGDILWFTDNKMVADQYRKRSVFTNEVDYDKIYDADTDLAESSSGIEVVSEQQGIDLTKGQVIEGNILMNKPLDLTDISANADFVGDIWDKLYKLGLLEDSWDTFDLEQIQDIELDYEGKALWVLLEGENVYDRARKKGYDVVMINDVGIDGKIHISYGLLNVNNFINPNNTNIPQIEASFSEAIENATKDDVLILEYPDGTKKYATKNSNNFIELDRYEKNVLPNSFSGFIAHLEKLGIRLDTKINYSPENFRKKNYETTEPITLYKGTIGKIDVNGKWLSAHPNVIGTFSSKDIKVAERYNGYTGENLQQFEIPAGTKIETIQVDEKGITPETLREIETELINTTSPDIQIVELITLDSRGKETQYIIKDSNIQPKQTENEKQISFRTRKEATSLSPIHKELEIQLGGYPETVEGYYTRRQIESNRDRLIRESKEVESWAKDKGYFISPEELVQRYRPTGIKGSESEIYLDVNNDNIIIKDFVSTSYNGFQGILGRILIHNYLFPNTAYKIIGFSEMTDRKGDKFASFILEQPLIKNAQNSTIPKIKDYFENMGFEFDEGTLSAKHPSGIQLVDLHEGNILETPDGTLFPIDIVAEFNSDEQISDISFNDFINQQDITEVAAEEKTENLGSGIKNLVKDKDAILMDINEINRLRNQKLTDLSSMSAIELSGKIEKEGIKEPLNLVYYPNEGKALLSDGHNRLDVSRDLGVERLPVKIVESFSDAPKNAKDWINPEQDTTTPSEETITGADSLDSIIEQKILAGEIQRVCKL